jgi:DNA-binding NarL/FixJ family response regulator
MRDIDEMMTKSHALIVTAPGSLQNGLLALMTAIPQVEVVGEASSAPAALQMVAECSPDLVLLDGNLAGNEPWALLWQIKNERPATRCIALADDVPQQQEAEAAGADIALVKGFAPVQLIAALERLLR